MHWKQTYADVYKLVKEFTSNNEFCSMNIDIHISEQFTSFKLIYFIRTSVEFDGSSLSLSFTSSSSSICT